MVEFCIYCGDHCSWAWLSNLTYQGSACLDFDLNCRSHLATRREAQSCCIHAGVLLMSYISVPETSPAGKLASFGNWHLGKLDRYSTKLVVENCFNTLQPQPDILFPCAIYGFIDMLWLQTSPRVQRHQWLFWNHFHFGFKHKEPGRPLNQKKGSFMFKATLRKKWNRLSIFTSVPHLQLPAGAV